MKKLLIAGNWKSNKGIAEAQDWVRQFNVKCQMSNVKWEDTSVVLCVPFTILYPVKLEIGKLKLPIELGAQDVSPYPDGAYTGEVSARQIKELADWVIIGHPERRALFHETDDMLKQKVLQAKNESLRIIYCVSDDHAMVPLGIDAVAYEPVDAIGSVQSDDPKRSNEIVARLKEKTYVRTGLYGGSVKPENVASFIQQPSIDGVIVGGASLDAEKFSQLVGNAIS